MAECKICGSYTKFNGGLCKSCYHKSQSEVEKNNGKSAKENPWVSGLIKGRIAETIADELFKSLGFQVFRYGMENSIPGIKDLLRGINDEVALNIKKMPDFVIFKNNRAHFLEVKFRASGKFSIKDIDNHKDYPFHNALILLISKKHIKCISFEELENGKEITPKCQHFLGNRKEFDTDKDIIRDYCKYAIKYFETV